jgi:hypothetical protein
MTILIALNPDTEEKIRSSIPGQYSQLYLGKYDENNNPLEVEEGDSHDEEALSARARPRKRRHNLQDSDPSVPRPVRRRVRPACAYSSSPEAADLHSRRRPFPAPISGPSTSAQANGGPSTSTQFQRTESLSSDNSVRERAQFRSEMAEAIRVRDLCHHLMLTLA